MASARRAAVRGGTASAAGSALRGGRRFGSLGDDTGYKQVFARGHNKGTGKHVFLRILAGNCSFHSGLLYAHDNGPYDASDHNTDGNSGKPA